MSLRFYFRNNPVSHNDTLPFNYKSWLNWNLGTSKGGDRGTQFLELYKCGNPNTHCEPVFSDVDLFGRHLVVDASNNEINLVGKYSTLIYTYGEHPRYYEQSNNPQLKKPSIIFIL